VWGKGYRTLQDHMKAAQDAGSSFHLDCFGSGEDQQEVWPDPMACRQIPMACRQIPMPKASLESCVSKALCGTVAAVRSMSAMRKPDNP